MDRGKRRNLIAAGLLFWSASTALIADLVPPQGRGRALGVYGVSIAVGSGASLLLALDGHAVQVAYDGDEALASYHAFRPRVALLDVGMPGQSGTEVAALASGFDHHLTKPIEIDQLESLIAALPTDQPAPRDNARKAS